MLNCLRFSRSGEKDPLVQEAVKAVRDVSGVEVVWVEEDVEPDKGCIYVLESFDTPHYNALLERCRIIGPAVVLVHLKHGWPLPASTQPVFSLAMYGVVACFTQAGNKEKRDRLTQLVKLMGGKVEGDFTKRVTHLIAGHVGSTKYHVARKLHLPVLLPSWVESSWSDGLKQVIYATHSITLTPHKAPPFTGLVITVTGLDEKTRTKVKEVCLLNGGNYSGELTKDVCTHLLVGSKSSTKYKYACQWKMYCVTPQWFYDSVESGYCMPEGEYDVDSEASGGVDQERERKANDWRKNLESFKVPTVSEDEFLDGCKIFLSGFKEEELMVLYKIVNLGGGVRLNRLSESISHVVLGEKEQAVLNELQQLDSSPHVVSAQWLLDSCTKGEMAGEESYLCEESAKSGGAATTGKKRKLPGDQDIASNDLSKRPRCHDYSDNEELDEDDLMNQYKAGDSPSEAPPTGSGVLSGKGVSVSKLFSTDDRKIAIRVVKEHRGKVVSPPNGSFHLLPLEVSGMTVEKTGASQVTMIWLQRCIEADTLLDPSSHFLFTPMTTPISKSTLSACVLAFSQFSDIEREHLVRFSRGLGAVVQDHFARYPAHGLLATTHLILKRPSGDKYTFAHRWGIPALADSWLFACAEAQAIVPVDTHLVSLLEPAPPPSVPALPTSSAAPPTSLSENMQLASRSVVAEKGPSRDSIGTGMESRKMESNINRAGEKSAVLSGVVISLSKKLGAQEAQLRKLVSALGAELRRRLDQKCTHFVYQGRATEAVRDRDVKLAKEQGCFIVSPHWITACSEQRARVEEADYPHTYNPNMALAGLSVPKNTLSQSQSRPLPTHSNIPDPGTSDENDNDDETDSDTTGSETESTAAQSSEAAKRLQEHLEQIKEAPMEQQKRRRSRRLLNKEEKLVDPPPPSHASHLHKSPHKKGRSRRDRRGRRKDEQILESQVTDSQLLQVTYDDPKGRKEKEKLLARIQREEELKARGIDPRDVPAPEDDFNSKHSDSETKKRAEKPRVSVPLRAARFDDNVNDRDLPPSTPAAPSLNVPIVTHSNRGGDVQQLFDEKSVLRARKPSPPKILLSSLDQREKVDYGALIQELGGEYIDQDYFTTKCTHLVVGKASRTEKYLGACAAGKWVLHKSYLEECRASHSFVKEEPHEWGAVTSGGAVHALEAAPRTWRLALAERQRVNPSHSGSGAFDGWKVLLFAERGKVPGLRRLLEAGGAKVLTTAGHKSATHAFISMSFFPKDSLSLEQLVRNGVHCLKPDYIAEYLSKGSAVQLETLYINEVRPLLQRKR